MGCADSKREATGPESLVQQAESRLKLSEIDVKTAFSVLRKYSNRGEITETQFNRITVRLQVPSLRPFGSFFRLAPGLYSLQKLAMLFLMFSSSSLSSKFQVFHLLWDPESQGSLSQESIAQAAEFILAISVDFAFSLAKDANSPLKQYKEMLQSRKLLPQARMSVEDVLGGQKDVVDLTEKRLGEALDTGNVRKMVKDLQIPDKKANLLEVGPENEEKRQNKGLSNSEKAQRRLIREELQPKLDKGAFE